jgi:hypothetical protein
MLLIDEERFFFFADESEPDQEDDDTIDSSAPPRSGVRQWIHDRIAKFKTAWQDAGSGALYWMHRAWDWLHTLVRPDEPMLARLRTTRRIKLHHPAAHSEVDVRAKWRNYLHRQWRRHFFWMGFNALITPFATALFILPGPNLIGFWFAYRTVHHGIVVWGISKAQRNLIPIELHSVKSLDQHIEADGDGNAHHTALQGAGEQLERHVAWWRGSFLGIPRFRPASDQAIAEKRANAMTRPDDRETGDHASSEL